MATRPSQAVEISGVPRVSTVSIRVTALSFLLMIADSYDVSALSFAVPELIREWHVDKIAAGAVFSAGLLGLLIGSIIFGHIGDRWGRRTAIISGTFLFGVLTFATGWVGTLDQMLALRFLACIGLGGAVPNAVALTNEYAPTNARVTAIAIIFAGYAIGGTFGGVIAAQLVPSYGWPIIFQLGGVVSLLLAGILTVRLPESVKFLAVREGRHDRSAVRSGLRSVDGTTPAASSFKALFAGARAIMTPLLWVVYVANSVTLFALVSWLPVLVEAAGLNRAVAALALSVFFLGGAVGGLLVGYLIDRSGMKALVASALIACPIVASLGMLGFSAAVLLAGAAAAGFFTIGVQNSLHGIAGKIYPTHIRANGMGWALGIGKVGSIAGPFIGGLLLSMALPVSRLFWAAAVPLAVVTVTAFFLMQRYDRTAHDKSTDAVAAQPNQPAAWQ